MVRKGLVFPSNTSHGDYLRPDAKNTVIPPHTVTEIDAISRKFVNAKKSADVMEVIKALRELPLPMCLRRSLEPRLLASVPYSATEFTRKKYKFRTKNVKNVAKHAELWGGPLKKIESRFGSGVTSYFTLLRYLFVMNLVMFLFIFLLIILPQISLPTTGSYTVGSSSWTSAISLASTCSALYNYTQSSDATTLVLDFIQGSGWMEITVMFYGYYSNGLLQLGNLSYSLPLAYLSVITAVFVISLFMMASYASHSFKQNVAESEGEDGMKYFTSVINGWDYRLCDEKNVQLKQNSIHTNIIGTLVDDELEQKHRNMSHCKKCGLYTKRFLINLFILCICGGAGYLIYFVDSKSSELISSDEYSSYDTSVQFLIHYMTSIVISVLNALIPIISRILVRFEDYRPEGAIQMQLVRTAGIRLGSLCVLIGSLFGTITCSPVDSCLVGTGTDNGCTTLRCWATYVGQSLYKLALMDFFVIVAIVFLVEFPRMLVVKKCNCGLTRAIGLPEFDVSKNVLDILYGQTLCWLAMYFSPMIVVITLLKFLLVFYIKMLSVLVNYKPAERPYKASKSNIFFLAILILLYLACIIPVGYVISNLTPPRSCGPFSIYNTALQVVTVTAETWPSGLTSAFGFLGSAGVIISVVCIVYLFIYYKSTMAAVYHYRTKILRDQLLLERKEKQTLAAKLQAMGNTNAVKSEKVTFADAVKGAENLPTNNINGSAKPIKSNAINRDRESAEKVTVRGAENLPADNNIPSSAKSIKSNAINVDMGSAEQGDDW